MEQRFKECVAEAKQRGQTVFLSSHILSEVEALCDRVAILREGELLEMGTLAQLRHLSAIVSTIESIVRAYPSISSRALLAQSSESFVFLNGVGHHLETVAGYTVWKVLTTTTFIGAIWGLRTAVGLLRAEEDAGRWELLLSGSTTRRGAAVQAMVGLGLALLAMFVVTAITTILAGQLPGAHFTVDGAIVFAAAMVAGAAIFLGVGAVASQLAASSSQASMLTTAVIGISYVIRVLADSSPSRGWLRWVTPMGWIENVQPLEDPQPLALVPILLLTVACAVVTVELAGRRDLNGSILRERDGRIGKVRWLRGHLTLAVRLTRTAGIAWLVGITGTAALLGSVANSYSSLLTSSPSIEAALGRLGVKKASEGYLGVEFFMTMLLITMVAASQIGAIRDEEATGRLDNLLVRPVPRLAWFAGRLGVSLTWIMLASVGAGAASWLGAASQHTGVSLWTLVQAGLNASVPALFVLGAGALLLGLLPRWSVGTTYAIIAWSLLIDLLAAFLKSSEWLKDSSLFTHVALAPAARPDWSADVIIVLLAVACTVVGAVAFQFRDLQSD